MSEQAKQLIRQHSKLRARLRDLLEAIASFIDDGLTTDAPTLAQIGKAMGIGPRHVTRLVQEAEASGELVVIRNQGRNTPRGKTNIYTLNIEGETQMSPLTSMSRNLGGVIDSLIESNKESNTTTRILDIHVTPDIHVYPSEDGPPQPSNHVVIFEIMGELGKYKVNGRHVRRWVTRVMQRPKGIEEIYDLLDYYDAYNQDNSKKPLTPAFIADDLKTLAAMPLDEPRDFRYCDRLEPEKDEFEDARQRYGGYIREEQAAYNVNGTEWRQTG